MAMTLDTKYSNNVIMQKEALQELLTNIKNYPIVDIDYIPEDEIDEQHLNAEHPEEWKVWERYTDGTPCIKITYGNPDTLKGNVIFAESLRDEIKQIKQYIRETTNAISQNSLDQIHWTKVRDVNAAIAAEKGNELESYNKVVEENSHDKAVEILNSYLQMYAANIAREIDDTYHLFNIQTTKDDNGNIINYYYTLYDENEGVIQQQVFAYKDVIIQGTNVTVKLFLFEERVKTILEPALRLVTDDVTSLVNEKEVAQNLIELIDLYPSYEELEQDTDNYSNNMLNIITYVITYLQNIQKAAENKVKAAQKVLNGLISNVTILETSLAGYKKDLGEREDWMSKVATGRYELTFDDNDKVNGVREISNDGTTYDRTMHGYKYVKVGSNIQFTNNLISNDQNYGTFKITVNGNATEVKVKGLDSSNTDNLKINVTTLPSSNESLDLGSTDTKWNVVYAKQLGNSVTTPISGYITDGYITNIHGTDIYGTDLGKPDRYFTNGYITNGYITNGYITNLTGGSDVSIGSSAIPVGNGYFTAIKIGDVTIGGESNSGDSGTFLRGDGAWIDTLGITGQANGNTESIVRFNVNKTGQAPNQIDNDGTVSNEEVILNTSSTYNDSITYYTNSAGTIEYEYVYNENTWETDYSTLYIRVTTYSKNTNASVYTTGGICAEKNIWGLKVFNAVFNDYAECRKTINLEAGRVVADNDDGSLRCTEERLIPGAQVISDTWGHIMGMTNECQTPLAVAGRVLVYTTRNRCEYHAGMAVCSGPHGTVDIMTREEIRDYPDCIIGIVSEIPEYEEWGTEKVKVNQRIWIKVR